jgi:DNA-binding CsgD family transcriptional regulator
MAGGIAPRPFPAIVGRERELEAIARWLERPRPALLEIVGEAGIGKTTLCGEALEAARATSAHVLSCRPAEIETAVSYGALASLLEPLVEHVADTVPGPRLHALEVALRLRSVAESRLDETAVALGALSALRAAATERSVVLAIDDVQWLDASSRVALTYALRNLQPGEDVAVLIARRLGSGLPPLELGGTALAGGAETLRPAPLSLGAVHRMITGRLGAPLSRPRIVHVHAASGGNPLFALELARIVSADGARAGAAPITSSLTEVLSARIGSLHALTRRLLLVVAAAGEPGVELVREALSAAAAEGCLDEAVAQGVLVVVDGRLRFSHPLLASAVYSGAGELDRGRVHARLAELADAPEERVRHLALTRSEPDAVVAGELAEVAEATCARGARGAGAALHLQAADLTPETDSETRLERMLAAADAYFLAGEPETARSLYESVAGGSSALRFDALRRLGTLLDETVGGDAALAAFAGALETADPNVAAEAHRGLAQALAYVGNLHDALLHAERGVVDAEAAGDRRVLAFALAMRAFVGKLAGHDGWRVALDRALAIEAEVDLGELDACPSAVEADTRRLLLDFDEARAAYERLLGRAAERGDVRTECWCRFGLASVEIASGRRALAAEHAEELRDLAEQTGLLRLPALRTAAQLAALRGDVTEARAVLASIVAEAEAAGELHNLRSALQIQGHLELSLGDHESAAATLERARHVAERTELREPSLLVFMLDEVEALVAAGDPTSAAAALQRFVERCAGHATPWLAALVGRSRGLVHVAERDLHAAREALEAAVAAEVALPLPLERARTRLVLGRVLRRLQARREAQSFLDDALERFEALGAVLWAERAREELGRIGGRAASDDDLTPTEGRIAGLVAEGLTNREVAAALFVTPKTVESMLTRIYRKLDVRSRTELVRRLAGPA